VAVIAACLGVTYMLASSQVTSCLALFYVGGLAAMARKSVAAAPFRPVIEAGAWVAALIIPLAVVSLAGDQLDRIDLPLFLTCTPILLFCLSREILVPAPLQKAIEAAGNMTYSSYLLHFPLQLVVVIGFAVMGWQIPLYDAKFFAAYLAATLLLSYLAYRHFEAPAQNIIRDYLLRARTATAKAALGATK
jgi:peptidoglycan/LPS O-acetylase OafA/YrhL